MTKRILTFGAAALAAGVLLPCSSGAQVLYSDMLDASVRFNSTNSSTVIDNNDATEQIGRSGTGGAIRRAVVLQFELPDYGAVSDPFLSAAFTFNLSAVQGINGSENVDLYGLPRRSAAPALASDFLMDASDPTPGVSLLQDNILVPASTLGLVTTDVGGSAALLSYLNAQYASGAGRGDFVLLRLNMEVIPSGGTDRYSLTMADGAAAANGGLGDLTIWPQITYTAVPEPTSLALLLVAGLFAGSALTQRRR